MTSETLLHCLKDPVGPGSAAPPRPWEDPSTAPQDADVPVLLLWDENDVHLFALLTREVLVGSSQDADISIGAPDVEEAHLHIALADEGVWYHALGMSVLENDVVLQGRQLLAYGEPVSIPGATVAVYRRRADVPTD